MAAPFILSFSRLLRRLTNQLLIQFKQYGVYSSMRVSVAFFVTFHALLGASLTLTYSSAYSVVNVNTGSASASHSRPRREWSVQSGAFRRPSLVVMATTPSALASTEETDDELDIDVKAKVKALIPQSLKHYNLGEIDFTPELELSRDMKLLVLGVTKPLSLNGEESLSEPLDEDIGDEGGTLLS
jgi:hypothetical protein